MLFQSDRTFAAFFFTVSHGQLLFRSGKTSAYPTRLDILFTDVRVIETRLKFEGISISEVPSSFLEGLPSKPTEMIQPGHRCFVLSGIGWQGFLVAGSVFFHEDDKNFFEPSHFDPGLFVDK